MCNPIKILHIITSLHTGGAENMLFNLVSLLDKNIFSHKVINLTEPGDVSDKIRSLGITVEDMSMKRGKITRQLLHRINKHITDFSPRIITSWMYHSNLIVLLLSHKVLKHVKICWKIHHSLHAYKNEKILTKLVIILNAFFSCRPDYIIFDSQKAVEQHARIGFNNRKSKVIPIGFDTDIFKPNTNSREEIRTKIGIMKNEFAIGLVGRYHPLKDHDTYLRAAKLVLKKHKNIKFIMVGKGIDKDNIALTALIRSLEIEDNIILLGIQDDIIGIYRSFDISCLSSISEAFPTVVGEAMSCATPCVATDVGDVSMIIGETGIVVPPRDAMKFAEALCTIIEMAEKRRKDLGLSARQRIIDLFSIQQIIRQYKDSFCEIAY